MARGGSSVATGKALARQLLEWKESKGLTWLKMAEAAGVSLSTLVLARRGKRVKSSSFAAIQAVMQGKEAPPIALFTKPKLTSSTKATFIAKVIDANPEAGDLAVLTYLLERLGRRADAVQTEH